MVRGILNMIDFLKSISGICACGHSCTCGHNLRSHFVFALAVIIVALAVLIFRKLNSDFQLKSKHPLPLNIHVSQPKHNYV